MMRLLTIVMTLQVPHFVKEIKGLSGPGVIGMGYVSENEAESLLVVHEDGTIKVRSNLCVAHNVR